MINAVEKKMKTKLSILDTTDDLITEVGFSHLTVNMIAVRSGVTRRTVYRHFANIDEIILRLVNKYFNLYNSEVFKRITEETTELYCSVELLFNILFSEIQKNKKMFNYLGILDNFFWDKMHESGSFNELYSNMSQIGKYLTKIIQNGSEKDIYELNDDPKIISSVMINTILSCAKDIHRNLNRRTIAEDFYPWNEFRTLLDILLSSLHRNKTKKFTD